MDNYTVILENGDVWATGTIDVAPTGYAGNLLDRGYKDVKEYITDMELRSWIGRSVGITNIPDDVIEWITKLTQNETSNSRVVQEVLRTKQE